MATTTNGSANPGGRRGPKLFRVLWALYKAPRRRVKLDDNADPVLDEKGKPVLEPFDWRKDMELLRAKEGKRLQIGFSFLASYFIPMIVGFLLTGILYLLLRDMLGVGRMHAVRALCHCVIEPAASVWLLWKVFHMGWHAKNNAGHLITMDRNGGEQVAGVCFEGEAPIYPILGWIAYIHSIGNEAVTTICESDPVIKYVDNPNDPRSMVHSITLTGKDGSFIRFATTPRLSDPVMNVRLFKQAKNSSKGVSDKYHDIVSSEGLKAMMVALKQRFKETGKHLSFDEVIDPVTAEDLMREGFQLMVDDQNNARHFVVEANEAEEHVIGTETGYAASDFHSKGILPEKKILDALSKRLVDIVAAQTTAKTGVISAEAYKDVTEKVRLALNDQDPVSAAKMAAVIMNLYDGNAEKMVDWFGVLSQAGFDRMATFLKEVTSKIPTIGKMASVKG